ncbi:MAG: YaiI/YqxD family protein [Clostridiales bacterium]|nr:YaiI/YqxD family protein [Clostridiales bacterium]
MKILVDADACPVKEIIVKIAKQYGIPVIMFVDTSHMLDDRYSEVVTVDKAPDSVDIALVNRINKGDVVITQDYGLAALALHKSNGVINQNGLVYSDSNIDKLLIERHLTQKARRSGGRIHGPKKRSKEDDKQFEVSFRKLISV